jgi:hypothetical protein
MIFKCFRCFCKYFRHMFQVFHCFLCMLQLLHPDVSKIDRGLHMRYAWKVTDGACLLLGRLPADPTY